MNHLQGLGGTLFVDEKFASSHVRWSSVVTADCEPWFVMVVCLFPAGVRQADQRFGCTKAGFEFGWWRCWFLRCQRRGVRFSAFVSRGHVVDCSLEHSENGTLVIYGNMSTKPHAFSLETLVLKNVKIQGFSLYRFVCHGFCVACSLAHRPVVHVSVYVCARGMQLLGWRFPRCQGRAGV